MWVRSDVTSGRNRRWEWRPDAGAAEDGKTTSDASGRGARASDAGLIFADVTLLQKWTKTGNRGRIIDLATRAGFKQHDFEEYFLKAFLVTNPAFN